MQRVLSEYWRKTTEKPKVYCGVVGLNGLCTSNFVSLLVSTFSAFADHLSIDDCVLSSSTLSSRDKDRRQLRPAPSLVSIPLSHTPCFHTTQVVITLVLVVSQYKSLCQWQCSPPADLTAIDRERRLPLVEPYASLRSVVRVVASLRFPPPRYSLALHHDSRHVPHVALTSTSAY